jgi:hypothetical protein
LLLLLSGGIELPRIGCWHEGRALYGVPGNLVVQDEGTCANGATWTERDAETGVRTLALSKHWTLAETRSGERYLIYRARERYELPQ